MLMGDAGYRRDVANISCWVANTFAKNRARTIVNQLFDCGWMIGLVKTGQ